MVHPVVRLPAVLPLATLGLLPSHVVAQPQAPAPQGQRDEPATKFDKFILSKGTVRVREFYDIGSVGALYGGVAKFEVARAYTPGRTDYALALRIEVTEGERPNRQRIGTMDADEVASLAAALPQMTQMVETLKRGTARNTEVDYRGGSLRVGVFVARTDGAFIQVGDVAPVHVFFDLKELDRITTYVNQAATKIKELQRSK